MKSTDEDNRESSMSNTSNNNNNNIIDHGVFEDVFVRTPLKIPPMLKSTELKIDPVKSTDLKLDPRPLLQVPSSHNNDSSGIREIKVIHTKSAQNNSKMMSINGVKRFTNFQNSTNMIDGKSETVVFSASSSGSDMSGATHVMQKSFKQQMMFNNNGQADANKLVNS